eukprot:1161297-Pelagomonas_calceolata.AAC.12
MPGRQQGHSELLGARWSPAFKGHAAAATLLHSARAAAPRRANTSLLPSIPAMGITQSAACCPLHAAATAGLRAISTACLIQPTANLPTLLLLLLLQLLLPAVAAPTAAARHIMEHAGLVALAQGVPFWVIHAQGMEHH